MSSPANQDYFDDRAVEIILHQLLQQSLHVKYLERRIVEKTSICEEKRNRSIRLRNVVGARLEAWRSRTHEQIQAAEDTRDDGDVAKAVRIFTMGGEWVVRTNDEYKLAKLEHRQAIRELGATHKKLGEAKEMFEETKALGMRMAIEMGFDDETRRFLDIWF
ncbi:hypothetical protein BKA81DRAFT_406437 [Phyllosticta paracitricarpa]